MLSVFKKILLFRFAMRLMLATKWAKLLEFETFRCRLLVLGTAIVTALTLIALQLDNFARHIELLNPSSKQPVAYLNRAQTPPSGCALKRFRLFFLFNYFRYRSGAIQSAQGVWGPLCAMRRPSATPQSRLRFRLLPFGRLRG
jgi:hypothetical protein